eukprot:6482604-Amphidinium_carterae.1
MAGNCVETPPPRHPYTSSFHPFHAMLTIRTNDLLHSHHKPTNFHHHSIPPLWRLAVASHLDYLSCIIVGSNSKLLGHESASSWAISSAMSRSLRTTLTSAPRVEEMLILQLLALRDATSSKLWDQ